MERLTFSKIHENLFTVIKFETELLNTVVASILKKVQKPVDVTIYRFAD